jgi:TolB-like protein
MKRCPECRRDYYDDTLSFCLDDGAALLEGPAHDETKTRSFGASPSVGSGDEPQMAILSNPSSEAVTRHQISEAEKTAVLPTGAVDKAIDKSPDSTNKVWLAAALAAILAIAGFFGYKYLAPNNSKQIESIAVLPFVNESGNADAEYLSDGMTETLISSLSQIPKLNVKARSSVFRYKSKETDLRKIAEELNVQAILTGRVVQRNEQLILTLELVDARTENILWAEQYNRKQTDLINLQNEIARDVSQKLKTKLSGADEQRLAKNYTENAEAYQLYLKGRFYWNKRAPEDIKKSIEYFRQAITLDPNYALAYAGLSDAYAIGSYYGVAPPREAMPKAKEAALKALSLDDRLSEVHAALALIMTDYDYDFAGAERECKRAIELNPNNATANLFYGVLLARLGRFEESFAQFKRALELEPLSLPINRQYGESLLFARRYDDAIAQQKKTAELDSSHAFTYYSLANAYRMKGNYAESVEEFAKAQERFSPRSAANAPIVRESFAKGGWEGFLREMTGEQTPTKFPRYFYASWYAALGEKDKAIAELEKTYESRNFAISQIKIDPSLDPLRDDPRFQELLKKVGFPP